MSLLTILIINFNFGSSISAEDEVPKPSIVTLDVSVSKQIGNSNESIIKICY